MGYLDKFRKKEKANEPKSEELASTLETPSQPAEIIHPATSGENSFGPPSISANAISSSSPLLSTITPGSSSRLYDPYEGISQAVVGKSRQVFKLPEGPEFLFEEEAAVRRRGWGENLQFYTGLGYVTGAICFA
jgi:hypothetical protein